MNNRKLRFPLARLVLALVALTVPAALASPAQAALEISRFDGQTLQADGSAATQAGAHPFSISTRIDFPTRTDPFMGTVPKEQVKNLSVELPPGLVGDPTAMPQCPEERLVQNQSNNCPADTQIGTAYIEQPAALGGAATVPLFNMVPPEGVPAQFGFVAFSTPVHLSARLQAGGDYSLFIDVSNISEVVPLLASEVTIWGAPADPVHDEFRGWGGNGFCSEPTVPEPCANSSSAPRSAFLSNPMHCAAGPLETSLSGDSWETPGVFTEASFLSHLAPPEESTLSGVTGCEKVPFAPDLSARPLSREAASPTGLDVDLTLPQSDNPEGIATGHLRRATVEFPAGMTVNSASAAGLGSCSPAQLARERVDSAPGEGCPEAAKIGTVAVATPLLEKELQGSVYLAQQDDPATTEAGAENPFDSLLAMYLVLRDPERGIFITLPGKVAPDPGSGRLTVTFEDNPQLPFESLRLHLKGGDRAPLVTPAACGTHTTAYSLSSWSGRTVEGASSFTIDEGCEKASRFAPGFEAGSANPIAGAYSPFTLRVTREDGEQNVARIDATLPEGLLAKLAGTPLCPDSAAPSGNCPPQSRVGSAIVGVGAGGNPLYVPQPGKAPTAVYLAGPYRGAPYSLVVEVPAQAGPFDLGTVAVRNALHVDPTSAQVSASSDRLPQILQGIPIAYRDIRVAVDKPGFAVNPTSCDPMAVQGTIASSQGHSAEVSSRFQVAGCERLGFKPHLRLKVSGPTKRAKYPRLRAELRAPAGQANIGNVSVALPRSQFLAQEHIRTICTRVQYAQKACPEASVYGWARAFTPLLDQPLEGPVYLRSSSNPLPDLIASLDGQIHIDLTGWIDSVNGGIRTTFEGVPDAPVSKFVLTMKGGKKSLLVNSRDLCSATHRATVKMDGQNGKVHDFRPVVKNSCGKGGDGGRK